MVTITESRVRVGSRVRLMIREDTEDWTIVPACEADAFRGFMADDTPVAKAVMDRSVGDKVVAHGPGGARVPVTILDVA